MVCAGFMLSPLLPDTFSFNILIHSPRRAGWKLPVWLHDRGRL